MRKKVFIVMVFMVCAQTFCACTNDGKKNSDYTDEITREAESENLYESENITTENEDTISIDEILPDIEDVDENMKTYPVKYEYNHNIDLSVEIIDELMRENPNTNINFSETSLNVLLGMLCEGADGETKNGINSYLMDEYSINSDVDIALKYKGLLNNYKERKDIDINLANSLWTNNIERIKDPYKNSLMQNLDAHIEEVDMTDMSSVDKINNWCGEITNNKIKSIVNYDDISNSENVMINALYFDGGWAEKFDDNNSSEKEFTNIDNTKSNIYMMNGVTNGYFENDYATGFAKYYDDNKTIYIAILPKYTGEYELKDLDLNSFLKSYSESPVKISIPKYKAETGVMLQEILKKNGLTGIFNEKADFSKMSDFPIYVDKIIQKTFIEVDEDGTKAAAITSANLSRASLVEETKEVEINRPFSYLIYDIENNEVLFIGKINKL